MITAIVLSGRTMGGDDGLKHSEESCRRVGATMRSVLKPAKSRGLIYRNDQDVTDEMNCESAREFV